MDTQAVHISEQSASAKTQPVRLTHPPAASRLALLGGGTDGNEQLTATTGVILLVLLAVIGVSILRIRQLIWLHLFVGLVLFGPVALKLGSTGYRFARYYTRAPAYRHKGPPRALLRAIAPGLVISTVAVLITGLLLLFGGATSKDSYLEIHKISFIVWIVFAALHVLGHLPGLPRSLRAARGGDASMLRSPGDAGRWIAVFGALAAGLVLGIVLLPDFASWTHAQALHRGG